MSTKLVKESLYEGCGCGKKRKPTIPAPKSSPRPGSPRPRVVQRPPLKK